MAKKAVSKKATKKVAVVKEEPKVEQEPVAEKVFTSLNAISAGTDKPVKVKEDPSKPDLSGINQMIEDIISIHFRSDKKLGVKAITRHLSKLLN